MVWYENDSADGEVPQLDRLVVAAGDDDEVVEADAGDAVRVGLERDQALAGLQAPDLDGLVVGGGDDAPRVGLEATNDTCTKKCQSDS